MGANSWLAIERTAIEWSVSSRTASATPWPIRTAVASAQKRKGSRIVIAAVKARASKPCAQTATRSSRVESMRARSEGARSAPQLAATGIAAKSNPTAGCEAPRTAASAGRKGASIVKRTSTSMPAAVPSPSSRQCCEGAAALPAGRCDAAMAARAAGRRSSSSSSTSRAAPPQSSSASREEPPAESRDSNRSGGLQWWACEAARR
mmetsp:Transcript_11232/g.29644  ORF Transcript_11232/g.29644 Transcript_11232/m.29644 type:complete len:206 (+) Transcript_11232:1250-1867(+)